jgi:hypothetical protein
MTRDLPRGQSGRAWGRAGVTGRTRPGLAFSCDGVDVIILGVQLLLAAARARGSRRGMELQRGRTNRQLPLNRGKEGH